MKKLLIVLLLFALKSNAQCWSGSSPMKAYSPDITPAVIIDKSMHYYPSGFAGTGVHVGIWINSIGFTLGGVESKIRKEAARDFVFTMLGKYQVLDDKIQIVPFFSVGSDNFQDVGLRVGYKIMDGGYLGAVFSRSMDFGINFTISVNKQKE